MVPILTYHSQNIRGARPADNDHAALAADLEALISTGKTVIPLDRMMEWLEGNLDERAVTNSVVMTFDDGCDFDVRDIEYPGHGMQRSFLGIMQDFLERFPASGKPSLHATSFVIASWEARHQIDAGSLFGEGWMSDDWWNEADANPLLSIENHGWDHNHPDLEGDERGNFHSVDNREQCMEQVVHAAESIGHLTGRRPHYFAYPFGESSQYIREIFFPEYPELHGCRAAVGTDPGLVHPDTDLWNLPRFVCGRDWTSPEELLNLLG
ncbi:MAG TPA: polysaccharide deacetylase family protein [Xanthomonadales bacterium]|nr:polysaccharide deacetylase family protein [Xanthomonadales bacterium]